MSEKIDPDEFERMLHKVLHKMFGSGSEDESDNPDDYTMSCEVQDDEAILIMEQLNMAGQRFHRKASEANMEHSLGRHLREKLFLRLEDAYPKTADKTNTDHAGCGWRRWKGKLYFVSWTRDNEKERRKGEKHD